MNFAFLPNGHALLLSDDPEPVDMRQYGGSKDAIVVGNVIQELDASKNVVFQWRSWDHIPITDSYTDFALYTVDLIHGNSLEVDNKGNIIFSMRNMSSIIKINRQTGNTDWILGGKENQFTFLNENESNKPNYFSYQHDARLLPNGDLTLFDNGNQHIPNYSRAVEYKLDEQNKTADLVWEYRHNPNIFSNAMGSVQRLPNGNTIIGWGNSGLIGSPAFTEVHPDKSVALEMNLPINQASYRVYKFPWVSQTPEASVNLEILLGNTYEFSNTTDTTGVTITFDQMNSSLYANVTVTSYNYAPVNPVFASEDPIIEPTYFSIGGQGITSYTGTVKVDLGNFPAVTNPKETFVYARSGADSNFVLIPTSYDSTKNELTFTTSMFGEFTFGTPQTIDSSYAPVPFSPGNADTVSARSVVFRWATYGIVSSFHLQIATDSLFHTIVIDTSGFNSSVFTDTTLGQGSFYYWRVNNTNSAGTSNWSDTASFYVSSTVGVENSKNTIPQQYYLSQNYPNPFNPSTVINHEIPKSSLVTLKVYDALGREVATLVNEEKPVGRYNVTFDASKYSSGIYFYRITAGNFIQTKKMILLK